MQSVATLQKADEREGFGALLVSFRASCIPRPARPKDIRAHLPGWTATQYTRLETGERAPQLDEMEALHDALVAAGFLFSLHTLRQFIDQAHSRHALQKTHKGTVSDDTWGALFVQLAHQDHLIVDGTPSKPLLAETSHLLDRGKDWRTRWYSLLEESSHKRLVVVRGSVGVGKSSEMALGAAMLLRRMGAPMVVITNDFRAGEHALTPEDALSMLLGRILNELRCPFPLSPDFTLEDRTRLLLDLLEHETLRVVIFADHSECLLNEDGTLALAWVRFLSRFLRSQHRAQLVLGTRQWPGWYHGEQIFVEELAVPPLPKESSVNLLQRLGLASVPIALLEAIHEKVRGLPQCLEWVAALVRYPHAEDEWETFEPDQRSEEARDRARKARIVEAIHHFLDDPYAFSGDLSEELSRILSQVVSSQRLSRDARELLAVLSLTSIPLARPALQVISPSGVRPLEELRRASLIVAYQNRAQLLPVVAAAVWRALGSLEKRTYETVLIQAHQTWLRDGQLTLSEAGSVVTELAVLLLKHQRFLDAAQYLIRYGWLAFQVGQTARLAVLATDVLHQEERRANDEQRCGGYLLHYFLSPFLGQPIDAQQRVTDYRHIVQSVWSGNISLWPLTEVYLVRLLAVYAMSAHHVDEAQSLLRDCSTRLHPFSATHPELQAALLEVSALVQAQSSDMLEDQHERERAAKTREQAISLYQECCRLLSLPQEISPLEELFLKKRLARNLTNLGYQLDRAGRFEEALPVLEQSIMIKEQGYVEPGSLASSYGEKSQALAALGQLDEALRYDQLALDDIDRLAQAGDTVSQQERWIYLVNRACLYLRMSRVAEAEALLEEAIPNIQATRERFIMLAKRTRADIQQWRALHPGASHYQLDWRWVDRLREAVSYNAFWWLAHAGPFTQDEQQEWDRLWRQPARENVQQRLETLIVQSRQRELATALQEEREPRLWYPAIPINEVGERISRLLQLEADIRQDEANEIIRNLYLGTIEERLCFLRLIAAADGEDREQFRTCNQCLHAVPTLEEMDYTLTQVRRLVRQGLQQPHAVHAAEDVLRLIHERLSLAFDPQSESGDGAEHHTNTPLQSTQGQQRVSAQAVKRFLEAVLQKVGWTGWQVLIDLNAHGPRIEAASHLILLPDSSYSLDEIVYDLFPNEVIGHVGDVVTGERSPLGILAVGTRGYMPASEGRALYYELQTATALGHAWDDSKVWLGTLSSGLASGVISPPQSFRNLYLFLRSFLVLYRLIRRPDQDEETAREMAHELALTLCLRVFRGVPHLEEPGVCYSKDVVYLRGLLSIQQAVAQDNTILDRLAIGRVAVEDLPLVERLGIAPPLQSVRDLAESQDLHSYVLSFEVARE